MTSRPIASHTPDSAATESQQSPVRLGLIGRGIDKSLAPAFHTIAGQMLGLDVTYELLPRDAGVLDRARRIARRARRCRLPRRQHHGAVQGVGLAGRVRCIRRGGQYRRREHAAARTGRSDERVQHRLLGLQVGLPPTLRERVTGDRCAAGRRRCRNRHRRGARRSGRDSHPRLRHRRRPIARTRRHAAAAATQPSGWTWRRRPKRPWTASTASSTEHRRDVPPARHTRRSRRDRRSAMALRRHLLADRDRADGSGPPTPKLARISGFDLFLGQGIDAFEIFTGYVLAPSVLEELETRMRVLERERHF